MSSFCYLTRLSKMGCFRSTQAKAEKVRTIRKPKPWKYPQRITKSELVQLQEEFWHTAPHYGGTKEAWDALRAAAEADLTLAGEILDRAGIIAHNADMTVCFDGAGTRYELPKYVLSDPSNLIQG